MAGFAKKLARLASEGRPEPPHEAQARGVTSVAPVAPTRAAPSLDELRERIAAILAKDGAPRPVPAAIDAPDDDPTIAAFRPHETPVGPVPRFARDALPGERVGIAPVWAARDADPSVLALLALDPALADCDPRRAVYVDTETTGLAGGAGTLAFLVGLAWFDPERDTFVLEQLLLTDLDREAALVHLVQERLAQASMIVTFNGKAFDLPLLRTRAVMTRMGSLPERPHLDLLHVVRRLHKHRLATCNLGRVEADILGQERVGDVAGADIALIYSHYLRTRDTRALGPVVRHNALDVLSMISLVGLYGEPLESWAAASQGETPAPPSVGLRPCDLASAAKVARRAGDLVLAEELATTSVARGGGQRALRVRGDVRRARGDKARALSDYESALRILIDQAATFEGDDDAGVLRLALAKLYEHHARAYDKALALIACGTPEPTASHDKRRARLTKKLADESAPERRDARRPPVGRKKVVDRRSPA
ncbi:MAG TPA: ribonuclease H-like domain-containing protein [Polyangiaceae bacterium]|nr:ribonuclease H-like domain-containing protein [Polyangiaceae bacterium]